MKRSPSQRLFSVVLSVAILGSIATTAGGSSDRIRNVRIRGQQVHFRRVIPTTLTHDGVIKHFEPGEPLITDAIALGIANTGYGTGVWFHVRPLDGDQWGWVSGAFVEEHPHDLVLDPDAREAIAASPVPRGDSGAESIPAAMSPSPGRRRLAFNDYLQTAANVATILVTIITLLGSRFFLRRLLRALYSLVLRSTPAPAMVIDATKSYRPHYQYGTRGGVPWHIQSTTR